MRQITDAELREIQVNILQDVLSFCERHSIRCWVVGGTAIGAVRHKGFIPWDDDIDIGMPREDYERFAKLYSRSNERYAFYDYRIGDGWYLKFGKVFDTKTETIETKYHSLPKTGVYIDVFPLDGLSNDYKKAKKISRKARKQCAVGERLFMSITYEGAIWKKVAKNIYRCIYSKFIRLSTHIRKFVRLVTKYRFDDSAYVGNLSDGLYGERQIIEKKWLEPVAHLPFENIVVPVPGDYDKYLTRIYGDYMQFPPIEQQKSHHSFIAYWKEEM